MKTLILLLLIGLTGCRYISIPEGYHVEAATLKGHELNGEEPKVLVLIKDKDAK